MRISKFIEQSRHAGLKYAIFRNWRQPTPHWDEFKKLYNGDSEQGRISIIDRAYTDIMKDFFDESRQAYPDTEYDFYLMHSGSFRNLDPVHNGTYLHSDPYDILHWQCRGATEWTLGESQDIYLIEPGDLIWFSANTKHKTENITEKYSLIFQAGPSD